MQRIRQRWTSVAVICVLWAVLGFRSTEGLQCYRCERTERESVRSANTDCLVNGTEAQCLPYQDRCFSYVGGESNVEKGCTVAENCIGNRICCQTDFCNAGYGADLKTGFGQPCEGEASCVQEKGMVCRRETTALNQLSRCFCAEGWFPLSAACLQQSSIGELCFEDSHCRLENSFCQFQQCRCGEVFFANYSTDSCQLKLSILSECNDTTQCRAHNSVCLQRCVCEFGYLYDEFSGHCSSACDMWWLNSVWTALIIAMGAVITGHCHLV